MDSWRAEAFYRLQIRGFFGCTLCLCIRQHGRSCFGGQGEGRGRDVAAADIFWGLAGQGVVHGRGTLRDARACAAVYGLERRGAAAPALLELSELSTMDGDDDVIVLHNRIMKIVNAEPAPLPDSCRAEVRDVAWLPLLRSFCSCRLCP